MTLPPRLLVTRRYRPAPGGPPLDHRVALEPVPDPALERVLASAPQGALVVAGGEPTLRNDLPALLAGLGARHLTLATDGLSLARRHTVEALGRLGVGSVRLPLHDRVPEAHDWLQRWPGHQRGVLRAAREVAAAGLDLELEALLTRPTVDRLVDLVRLGERLRARRVVLRRVEARGPVASQFAALSPRLALLEPLLEAAVVAGRGCGVEVVVVGVPRCALGRVQEAWAADSDVGPPELIDGPCPTAGACARCPGSPGCAGAAQDYVLAFGWAELLSTDGDGTLPAAWREASPVLRPLPSGASPDGLPAPAPRFGRAPATRVRSARGLAGRSVAGDPLLDRSLGPIRMVLRTVFLADATFADPSLADVGLGAPSGVLRGRASALRAPPAASHPAPPALRPPGRVAEHTRSVRLRLVRAAQEGARTLRLASGGTAWHPDAPELLREALRLRFDRVELAGELSPLAALDHLEVLRLRGLARLDAALYAPTASGHDALTGREGSHAAALEVVARFRHRKVAAGVFAVVRPGTVAGWNEVWQEFAAADARLHRVGGSLAGLAEEVAEASEALRAALLPHLPPCLVPRGAVVAPAPSGGRAWGVYDDALSGPSASDRLGTFTPCPHAAACAAGGRCPGLAEGWGAEGVRPL